jgi:hypothetical protein
MKRKQPKGAVRGRFFATVYESGDGLYKITNPMGCFAKFEPGDRVRVTITLLERARAKKGTR